MPRTLDLLPLVSNQAAAATATSTSKPLRLKGPNALTSLRSHQRAKLRVRRTGAVGTVAVYGAELPNPDVAGYPNVFGPGSITRWTAGIVEGRYDVRRFQLAAAAATLTATGLTHAAFDNYNLLVRVHKRGGALEAKNGTLAGTQGKHTLTGTNTRATTELEPGMIIYADGYYYHVAEIRSDTDFDVVEPLETTLSGDSFTGEGLEWLKYNASAGAASTDDDFKVTSSSGTLALGFGCNRYTSDKFPIGTVIDVFKGTPREILTDGTHQFEDVGIVPLDIAWVVGTAGTSDSTSGQNQSATDVILEASMVH